jgi:hypothetical protein
MQVVDMGDRSGLLPAVYGLLAAITLDDRIHVTRFLQSIHSSNCHFADQPHFYHLFDELHFLKATKDYPSLPLLHFLMELNTNLVKHVRNIKAYPLLGRPDKYSLAKQGSWTEALSNEQWFDPDSPLPRMMIVPEGFDVKTETVETRDIKDLIKTGQYMAAVIRCTGLLDVSPRRGELFFQRALALILLGKDIDALLDLERCGNDLPREAGKIRSDLLERLGLPPDHIAIEPRYDERYRMAPKEFFD